MVFFKSLFATLIALSATAVVGWAIIIGKASPWWFLALLFFDLICVAIVSKPDLHVHEKIDPLRSAEILSGENTCKEPGHAGN